MSDRIRCIVPECRRTAPKTRYPDCDQIICGRCWRTTEPKLRARYKQIGARFKRIDRLVTFKVIQQKPTLELQLTSIRLLHNALNDRMWRALCEDAQMKSRLRVEGTAGWLATKRRAG